MTQEHQAKQGRTMGWLAVAGIAVLLAVAVAPAAMGTANAASPAPTTASSQWAYGGQSNATGTYTSNGNSITWSASLGWTVIFTATNTSNTTVELEEQRTVGIDFTTTFSSPTVTATYTYHGTESDVAFVNLTDAATVYANGSAVPAIGIVNEAISVQAAVDQSIHASVAGHSKSGWLNVSGTAQGSVAFTPSLGIVPLNLSGIQTWNSSATASPAVSWNIDYVWNDQGWNGTTRSGNGTVAGNWTGMGPVNLTGFKVTAAHGFLDHKPRTAIVLIVQGPVDAYDGYLLVPHNFDLFGGASHGYDAYSLGSASVASGQGETLYVSNSPRGPMTSDADTSFGGTPSADSALGQPMSGSAPAASSPGPNAAVQGQPMTVPAAQAESVCLTTGCSGTTAASTGSLLGIALIALAVIAVVGTVGVVEWRAYARRRSQKGLVGGYGERWTDGVPPAASQIPPASTHQATGPEGPKTPP